MATKEIKETETVEVLIRRAADSDDPNLFVGFNGVNYILPRGKKSVVPKAVAEEITRSLEAQMVADERKEKMEQK